jgi:hypothetical protein
MYVPLDMLELMKTVNNAKITVHHAMETPQHVLLVILQVLLSISIVTNVLPHVQNILTMMILSICASDVRKDAQYVTHLIKNCA